MRFIHTSDWHLGQTLHHFERRFEHQCFLDWLLATLVTEQAQTLLISGDIFDNANPSAAAQKQFYQFLQQAKARVPALNIVIIAGNHDSPGRLEMPAPFLAGMDASVIGFVPRDAAGQIDVSRLVIPLQDTQGVAAWCLAIPFLRPGDVPRVADLAEGLDPYTAGITALYQQTLAHALSLRQAGQPIIALGHCHMVGGEVSQDSERPIVIGGSEALSAKMFDANIAYAALGHLHLAQMVGQQAHIRYCGSPIPLSFAEVAYPHQVLRFDTAGETVVDVTPLLVPRAVDLLRVPNKAAPMAEVLAALAALNLPADLAPEQYPFLEVRIALEQPEPGLRAQIEAAIEGKPVRLAKIETRFAAKNSAELEDETLPELAQLQPDAIFNRLYRSKYAADAPPELMAALAELMLNAGADEK
ncbi:exonuclease SbcCD subunit D C-terminal domain-containing protein [Deefgea piscis]|uniref:Nuclease SbcCD subunit D n=1 Tax=Deefgea piscis TaxID=2739061 RepID=A0A6M8SSG1_9NEIS|nr:exonuclease SbcCD subunit D C-terminal domain-containing protein [Deefgea piscis]QKJ67084.1 exonuclease SbcCD subunit D C-terminal domain-containing protein [Deefgea piscis]